MSKFPMSYPNQLSSFKNLTLLQRERLIRGVKELRTTDQRLPHKLDLVLIERSYSFYFIQLDKMLVKIKQDEEEDEEPVEEKNSVEGQKPAKKKKPVEIQYACNNQLRVVVVQPENGNEKDVQIIFKDPMLLFTNPDHPTRIIKNKNNIDEAAMAWLANYLDRPGTEIGRLILRAVPDDICHRFQIEKVDVLDLSHAEPFGNSFLLTENAQVRMIQCASAAMLQNGTARAAKHVVVPVNWQSIIQPQEVMDLSCLKLEITGSNLPSDFVLNLCREIVLYERPLGFFCSLPFFGKRNDVTLDGIGEQLKARKTTISERNCITLDVPTNPGVELNLRANPEEPRDLWIEVSAKGTATSR